MKILVLSDSHSGLHFMREAADKLRPDVMIHLGDYYEDGQVMADEYPGIPCFQVPGNCDMFSCFSGEPDILREEMDGVTFFLTHGHRHGVKRGTQCLLEAARAAGADAVLYGHTHVSDCRREPDGLWVLNPGSCRSASGSVGMILTEPGKIVSCLVLDSWDLDRL